METSRESTPRVECRGVGKVMPSGDHELRILAGIDLAVGARESIAILGPSGSGKSTLLGLMAGLDKPSEGSIRLDGQPLERLGEDELALLRRGRVGFVFQSFHLFPNLTALENVRVPLELTGIEGGAERAVDLLERVGLEDRGHHYPSQLSGGEMQRVALARAFGPRPTLLLADEPTGNLDTTTGQHVLELLLELRDHDGTTLVLVTHDPIVAERMQRRVHLDRGAIVQES